jgi:hypothetical protein
MVMARKSIGERAGNVRLAVEFVVAMTTRRVTNKYGIVLVQKIEESKHEQDVLFTRMG